MISLLRDVHVIFIYTLIKKNFLLYRFLINLIITGGVALSRLIKDNGIIALAKLILNLADQTGKENTLKIIENSPGVFIDLLSNKKLISEKLEDIDLSKRIIPTWTKDNIDENIEKLKLTSYQALILFSIIKYKNSATLSNLIEEFEKNKISVGTGSVIGGSLGGISKKCTAYGVPKIFKIIKGKDNQDIYSIVFSDSAFLKIFKKYLKTFFIETT